MAKFNVDQMKGNTETMSKNFSLVHAFSEYIVDTMNDGDDKSLLLIYSEGDTSVCTIGGDLRRVSASLVGGILKHKVVEKIFNNVNKIMCVERLSKLAEGNDELQKDLKELKKHIDELDRLKGTGSSDQDDED